MSLPTIGRRALFCRDSVTGWKIGWACAPAPLVDAVRTAKQYLTYVNGAPFQPAIAAGLGLGDDYFDGLRASLQAKRDLLCEGLESAGLSVLRPAGTYFATVDLGDVDALAWCRSLPHRCGVVAIPTAIFYDHPEAARSHVRFAFCKQPEVLTEALRRLSRLTRC